MALLGGSVVFVSLSEAPRFAILCLVPSERCRTAFFSEGSDDAFFELRLGLRGQLCWSAGSASLHFRQLQIHIFTEMRIKETKKKLFSSCRHTYVGSRCVTTQRCCTYYGSSSCRICSQTPYGLAAFGLLAFVSLCVACSSVFSGSAVVFWTSSTFVASLSSSLGVSSLTLPSSSFSDGSVSAFLFCKQKSGNLNCNKKKVKFVYTDSRLLFELLTLKLIFGTLGCWLVFSGASAS